jgi:hypothetical protein
MVLRRRKRQQGRMIRNGAKRVCEDHTDSKSFEFADGTTLVFRRVAEITDEDRQLDIYLCDTRVESEQIAFPGAFRVNCALSGSVAENERRYSNIEIERADEAMRVWNNLGGVLGQEVFEKMLRYGTISGVKINQEDLRRAIRIKGRPLAAIRGRTKNSKVRKVDPTPIYRTIDKLLVMRIDIMFINSVAFLVSIVNSVYMGMANYIARRTAGVVHSALRGMMAAYISHGFTITDIVCDGEGAIAKLRVGLEEKGTRVHVAGKGTHVPEAEERVRTYKEGIRGILNTLPFKLPFALLMWLVYFVVSRRNMVPHSAASEFIPPVETFRCRKLNFDADIKLPFGAY